MLCTTTAVDTDLSIHQSLRHRLLGKSSSVSFYSVLQQYGPSQVHQSTVLPFALTTTEHHPEKLVLVSECGHIRLLHCPWQPEIEPQLTLTTEWSASRNALYDVTWSDRSSLCVASADSTASVWDAETRQCKGVLQGHSASVKCIRSNPLMPALLVTGSRDGSIRFWDTRQRTEKTVDCINNAHLHKQTKFSINQSLTGVEFLYNHQLISTGCPDGTLRWWDLRKHYSHGKQQPLPLAISAHCGQQSIDQRQHVYVSLTMNRERSRVYAVSSRHAIAQYDTAKPGAAPLKQFTQNAVYQQGSFFARCLVDSQERYLIAGAYSGHVVAWSGRRSLVALDAFSNEVTCLAQMHDQWIICSDDRQIQVWRPQASSKHLQDSRHISRPTTPISFPALTVRSETLFSSPPLQSPVLARQAPPQATVVDPPSSSPLRTPRLRQRTLDDFMTRSHDNTNEFITPTSIRRRIN